MTSCPVAAHQGQFLRLTLIKPYFKPFVWSNTTPFTIMQIRVHLGFCGCHCHIGHPGTAGQFVHLLGHWGYFQPHLQCESPSIPHYPLIASLPFSHHAPLAQTRARTSFLKLDCPSSCRTGLTQVVAVPVRKLLDLMLDHDHSLQDLFCGILDLL